MFAALFVCVSVAAAAEGDPNAILTLDRIFEGKEFEWKAFGPARWLKDGRGYTTVEASRDFKDGKDIVCYDPRTGEREVLVPTKCLVPEGRCEPLAVDDYQWSADGRKVLIFTNTQRVWRLNTRGDYWVCDLKAGTLRKIDPEAPEASLMFAKFAPAADRVAYVRENNLYIQDLATGHIRQLTDDGGGDIINGTGDWVYEEEFYLRDGFRFSPDGRFIACWQFDTRGVDDFVLVDYTEGLYPKLTTFKYPKAGRANSACRVGVVSCKGGKTRWVDIEGDPRNHYIPKMQWIAETNALMIQQLNRLQNANRLMRVEVGTDVLGNPTLSAPETVLAERDEAWVDVEDDAKWLEGGRSFLWISERDGWRHLYRVEVDAGRTTLLTPGDFDVIDITGVDEARGWVFFSASPDNPTQRYLYRSALAGGGLTQRVTPLDQEGTHNYEISPDCRWGFHTYSRFDSPAVVDLVCLAGHESLRVLEGNQDYRARVAALKPCNSEFFRVDIGEGVELDGWCIRPPDFDATKKYPLLFYVYGEPAGQTVLDRWTDKNEKHLWHLMLAQQGYIVASVDNRGTPAPRGRTWRKCVYRRIGILASADQAAAVRALVGRWPFVDPERIGVWGWSGGGSMTLNAMFRYPDVYQTGMAIAFVADQRYYDTIYQERYMGLPEDNAEGFRDGSPITFADRLAGNLLLVYGTGDDNCHYQNCEALIDALIRHNKQFSLMTYPNRTHSIKEGENTRRHLYETMTRCLHEKMPAGE
jgi:dipeptidyl-peptidase-4